MRKPLLLFITMGLSLYGFAQEIEFETVMHDFGQVYFNDPAVYDFVFTNTGTKPLLLQKPRSSCGCLIPSWPKDPIMPGKKETVRLTYKTNRKGNFNKSVTVSSNATNSQQIILRVKGNVLETEGKVSIKNGKFGYENANGKAVVPFQYEQLTRSNGLFHAKKNGKWGIVDYNNQTIIPIIYDEEFDYSGAWMMVKKNGKWGVISTEKVIIPCEYSQINDFGKGIITHFQIWKNGKWGVADRTGRIIIPCENGEVVSELGEVNSDMVTAKKNGKWGMIGKLNKIIIPFEYEELSFTDYEVLLAKKNGKMGVVGLPNKIIIPFEYEELSFTEDEVLLAKKNGKLGIIDKKNKALTSFFADSFSYGGGTTVFFQFPSDLHADFKYNIAGLWGIWATNGTMLIPPFLGNLDNPALGMLLFDLKEKYHKALEQVDLETAINITKEYMRHSYSDITESEIRKYIQYMKDLTSPNN